jgi:hypothetical protein
MTELNPWLILVGMLFLPPWLLLAVLMFCMGYPWLGIFALVLFLVDIFG